MVLADGDRKSLATDRIVLVPGPPEDEGRLPCCLRAPVRVLDGQRGGAPQASAPSHHGVLDEPNDVL